jgi:hypothetical protein
MEKKPRYQGSGHEPGTTGGDGGGAMPGKVGGAVRRIGRTARHTGEKIAKDLGPVAKRVGRAIGGGVGVAAEAAKVSARVVAIRAQVAAAQASIAVLFGKIGEAYYKSARDTSGPSSRSRDLKPLVVKVDQLYEKIAGLKDKEKEVRAKK